MAGEPGAGWCGRGAGVPPGAGTLRSAHGAGSGLPLGRVGVGALHVRHVHEPCGCDDLCPRGVGAIVGAEEAADLALARRRLLPGGVCRHAAPGRSGGRNPGGAVAGTAKASRRGSRLAGTGGPAGGVCVGLPQLPAVRQSADPGLHCGLRAGARPGIPRRSLGSSLHAARGTGQRGSGGAATQHLPVRVADSSSAAAGTLGAARPAAAEGRPVGRPRDRGGSTAVRTLLALRVLSGAALLLYRCAVARHRNGPRLATGVAVESPPAPIAGPLGRGTSRGGLRRAGVGLGRHPAGALGRVPHGSHILEAPSRARHPSGRIGDWTPASCTSLP